jgi:hypothetical protein
MVNENYRSLSLQGWMQIFINKLLFIQLFPTQSVLNIYKYFLYAGQLHYTLETFCYWRSLYSVFCNICKGIWILVWRLHWVITQKPQRNSIFWAQVKRHWLNRVKYSSSLRANSWLNLNTVTFDSSLPWKWTMILSILHFKHYLVVGACVTVLAWGRYVRHVWVYQSSTRRGRRK